MSDLLEFLLAFAVMGLGTAVAVVLIVLAVAIEDAILKWRKRP